MLIREISEILEATILCGEENAGNEVLWACGSDLMSDVLAFDGGRGSALITGLVNPQVIRTAEMMDIQCIIFARGKTATPEMLEMAKERDITLMTTTLGMLSACGRLYVSGLRGDGEHLA
jgi:DRTGG domain.